MHTGMVLDCMLLTPNCNAIVHVYCIFCRFVISAQVVLYIVARALFCDINLRAPAQQYLFDKINTAAAKLCSRRVSPPVDLEILKKIVILEQEL